MKIWLKNSLAIIVAMIVSLFLTENILPYLSVAIELAENIVTYILPLLLFFSLVGGSAVLLNSGGMLKSYSITLFATVLVSLLITALGALVAALFISRNGVDIPQRSAVSFDIPSAGDIVFNIFPDNIFSVFVNTPLSIPAILFLAVIIGTNLNADRQSSDLMLRFSDAASRVFYQINSFLTELATAAILLFVINTILLLRNSYLFDFLLLLLGYIIIIALFLFIVWPFVLSRIDRTTKPIKHIRAVLPVLLAAFASGNFWVTFCFQVRVFKENLAIRHRFGSFALPVTAFFCRPGSAIAIASSFMLIYNSMFGLGITGAQFAWIIFMSWLISLPISFFGSPALFIALSYLLFSFDGEINPASYIIMLPIAPLLNSFAVTIDALSSSFLSLLLAKLLKMQKKTDERHFC